MEAVIGMRIDEHGTPPESSGCTGDARAALLGWIGLLIASFCSDSGVSHRRSRLALDPVIAFSEVTKSFGSIDALDPIRLTIRRGEFVSLVGPSGCGKSTVPEARFGGLIEPTEGTVSRSSDKCRLHLPGTHVDAVAHRGTERDVPGRTGRVEPPGGQAAAPMRCSRWWGCRISATTIPWPCRAG